MLFGIIDGVPDMVDFLFLMKSAHRACENALTAIDTGGVRKTHIIGGSDFGLKPAVDKGEQTDLLHLLTGVDTPAALDALGVVAHDGSGQIVDFASASYAVERIAADAVFFTQILEFAVFIANAFQTGLIMIRQDQFNVALRDCGHARCCFDHHTSLTDRRMRCIGTCAFHFDRQTRQDPTSLTPLR
jgi:hypothetical protein